MAGDSNSSRLQVNSRFNSLVDLEKALEKYQNTNFVRLYKRRTRRIASTLKRTPKKRFNPRIKFTEIEVRCIHGGKRFVSRSSGKKPNQLTFQQNCPFLMIVKATDDGQQLEVKSMESHHNHGVSKALFDHLPQSRKLSSPAKRKAIEHLQMKANWSILQNHLMQQKEKVVLLKDLHNLANAQKKPGGDDFNTLLEEMKKDKGAVSEVLVDENDVLVGIYYQTVDGNGESEIVALWFVRQEDRETVGQMIKIFKSHNPKAGEIRIVMADKDLTERDIITEELPEVQLLICLFHTMRSFKREVSARKMGMTRDQRMLVLEILTKLVYSRNEEEYMEHYGALRGLNIKTVSDYFDKHWHHIRKQWVEGLKCEMSCYLTTNNNRIECINQKLKSVVTKSSSVVVFWRDLMKCANSLSTERDHRATEIVSRRPILKEDDPDIDLLSQYCALLTPFAFKHLKTQVKKVGSLTVTTDENDANKFIVKSGRSSHDVTVETCTCSFWTSMCLPCCHIMAVRRHVLVDEYVPILCAERWKKDYYMKRHRIFLDEDNNNVNNEVTHSVSIQSATSTAASSRTLSQSEKYWKSFNVLQSIASFASEMRMKEFERFFDTLKTIECHVKNGTDFILLEVPEGSNRVETSWEGGVDQQNGPLQTSQDIQARTIPDQEEEPLTIFHCDGEFDGAAGPSHRKDVYSVISKQNKKKAPTSPMASGDGSQTNSKKQEWKEKFLELIAMLASTGCLRELAESARERSHEGANMLRYCAKDRDAYSQSVKHAHILEFIGGSVEEFVAVLLQYEDSRPVHGDTNAIICLMDSILTEFVGRYDLIIPASNLGNSEGEVEDTTDGERVQLPPRVKRKGRPKGMDQTAIGLPRKMMRKEKKPVPFIKLPAIEKEKVMLGWIVKDASLLDLIVPGSTESDRMVEKEDLKRVEKIPGKVVDEVGRLSRVKNTARSRHRTGFKMPSNN
ncbi:hypothetical protein GJAV_G00151020 [Gymnothorax javanicus]|nr:hypothetical protein GJAV_G00151020 [Gymnothorax javanicus]